MRAAARSLGGANAGVAAASREFHEAAAAGSSGALPGATGDTRNLLRGMGDVGPIVSPRRLLAGLGARRGTESAAKRPR
jgi:hypothetical protein